jgi:hypothetical protein
LIYWASGFSDLIILNVTASGGLVVTGCGGVTVAAVAVEWHILVIVAGIIKRMA